MAQTYSLLGESSASAPPPALGLNFPSVQSGSIPNVPGLHFGKNLYVKIDIDEGRTHRNYKTPVARGSLAPKWDFAQTM
jgi:hypothetical protein